MWLMNRIASLWYLVGVFLSLAAGDRAVLADAFVAVVSVVFDFVVVVCASFVRATGTV